MLFVLVDGLFRLGADIGDNLFDTIELAALGVGKRRSGVAHAGRAENLVNLLGIDIGFLEGVCGGFGNVLTNGLVRRSLLGRLLFTALLHLLDNLLNLLQALHVCGAGDKGFRRS